MKKFLVFVMVLLSLVSVSTAEAGEFTLAPKVWSASSSVENLESEGRSLWSGISFALSLKRHMWITGAYERGEASFVTDFDTPVSFESREVGLIVGWKLAHYMDVGLGYYRADITTKTGAVLFSTSSEGPVVHLASSRLFGKSWLGYYLSATSMVDDLETDDGSLTWFKGEGGFRWTSKGGLSVLPGYRYKEYMGDGAGGFTLHGPILRFAYTWR